MDAKNFLEAFNGGEPLPPFKPCVVDAIQTKCEREAHRKQRPLPLMSAQGVVTVTVHDRGRGKFLPYD